MGRQQVDDAAIERFLQDYGLSWQTDTEVGAERLVEAGGRDQKHVRFALLALMGQA